MPISYTATALLDCVRNMHEMNDTETTDSLTFRRRKWLTKTTHKLLKLKMHSSRCMQWAAQCKQNEIIYDVRARLNLSTVTDTNDAIGLLCFVCFFVLCCCCCFSIFFFCIRLYFIFVYSLLVYDLHGTSYIMHLTFAFIYYTFICSKYADWETFHTKKKKNKTTRNTDTIYIFPSKETPSEESFRPKTQLKQIHLTSAFLMKFHGINWFGERKATHTCCDDDLLLTCVFYSIFFFDNFFKNILISLQSFHYFFFFHEIEVNWRNATSKFCMRSWVHETWSKTYGIQDKTMVSLSLNSSANLIWMTLDTRTTKGMLSIEINRFLNKTNLKNIDIFLLCMQHYLKPINARILNETLMKRIINVPNETWILFSQILWTLDNAKSFFGFFKCSFETDFGHSSSFHKKSDILSIRNFENMTQKILFNLIDFDDIKIWNKFVFCSAYNDCLIVQTFEQCQRW